MCLNLQFFFTKVVKIGNISLPEFPLLLAPMEDVSDPPFRAVCKDNGADLMFSEFISSEGLIRDAIKSKQKLDFDEEELPCPNVCENTGASALLEQVLCPFTHNEVCRQNSKNTNRYVYFRGVMDIGYKALTEKVG